MEEQIFLLPLDWPLKHRSSWDDVNTNPNHNSISLDKDLDDFLKILHAKVPKFKELVTDQALYDTSISLVVLNSTSDLFELFYPFLLFFSFPLSFFSFFFFYFYESDATELSM